MLRIATCQYQLEVLASWEQFVAKISRLVEQAKQQGAQLVLLPEYAGIEAACAQFKTDQDLFVALQPLLPRLIDFYKNLAQHYQIHLQPGTLIEAVSAECYVNRAYFFAPSGAYGYQDKLQLTAFEKSLGFLQHGTDQIVFTTALGKIGIAICYDSEFPEIVRNLTASGAELILVPSYTTTLSGYYRVSLSSRARAIENQCYVAVAYVVNTVSLSAETENTFGQAAIFGPADTSFPDDGIIAQGEMNAAMTVVADVSLEKMHKIRRRGQVHNFADSQAYQMAILPNQFIML